MPLLCRLAENNAPGLRGTAIIPRMEKRKGNNRLTGMRPALDMTSHQVSEFSQPLYVTLDERFMSDGNCPHPDSQVRILHVTPISTDTWLLLESPFSRHGICVVFIFPHQRGKMRGCKSHTCLNGGNGRHPRLKILWSNPYQFDSGLRHHPVPKV